MAKKEEKVIEPKSKMQETMDRLNKTHGAGSITLLGNSGNVEYDVISSGSIGFDYLTLGVGGFVKGKLYEIMSWEGAGKTTIAGHAVANCQKDGGVALYIDGEHAVDKPYFQALGIDWDKMLFSQPSTGEEGFSIAMEMIESGEVDLVIIDSDSSLLPKKVIEGEIGDSSIGKKAWLNNNAYPKLKGVLSKHNVCVIVISQYREKIGVMFGNPTTTQGGHALKFYTDARIEMTKVVAKEGDVPFGNTVKVKAIKNKMSSPYKISQFNVVWGVGIDKIDELMQLASDYEVIKKWGKQITVYNEDKTETKYDIEEYGKLLQDNEGFFQEMKQKVVNKIKNG